jgi:DtxR family Mn-dependent transcriptional regulator/ferrous iron transport protein A
VIVPIHRLKPGQTAQVVELKSVDPARLDRLGAYGLVPGSWVLVQQLQPALILRVGETEISIDRNVAKEILVRAGKPKPPAGPAD